MAQINIMAYRHSAFYSPLLLCMAGGYLRNEGLEPTYTLGTPARTVPGSLADGTCHVAQSAIATNFPALESGAALHIVHFAQINVRDGFFIAGRKPEPDFTWRSLIGKNVLVDHFFQPLAMFKYGLHRQGVDFAQLKAIDAGDVNAIERAFRNGQGDYVHLQGPAPQQLEQEGIGAVVAVVGDAVGPVAFSSLCATPEWLHTDMARAFMRAYRRARDFAQHAPAAEIAALEAAAGFFPGVERGVLIRTITAYQQLGCWSGDAAISAQSYENLLEVFLFSGLITRRHPYATAVTAPPA